MIAPVFLNVFPFWSRFSNPRSGTRPLLIWYVIANLLLHHSYFKEYRPTTAEEQEVRAVVAKYLEDRAMAGGMS